jgi:ABC-type nitrate/sulfonate/bicarbonate transport system substrate-binding protein
MQRRLAGFVVLAMALQMAGCTKENGKTALKEGAPRVTVRFANLGISDGSIPLFLGIKKGYFAEQGIDLEIRKFNGGPEAITAAAAGEVDAGSIGTPILIGAVKGVPIRIIGSPGARGNPFVLVARPGFNSITDLKGRRIGGGNPGGGSRQAFLAIARSKGLTLADFQVLDTGSTANAFAALQAGQLDAAITSELSAAKAEIEGYGKVVARAADYFGRYQHSFFFATKKFSDQNPDALKGLLAGYRKSIDYVKAHPEEAIQFGIRELELEEKPLRRVFERTLAKWDAGLDVDLEGTNNAIAALKELGDMDKSAQLRAEQLIDLRFLPK